MAYGLGAVPEFSQNFPSDRFSSKTYWIRPDAGLAGGILNTATAGSVNACRSLEVLEDDLMNELGVELLGVDSSARKQPG